MKKGLFYTFIATLFGGLNFALPSMVIEFSPLEITIGRYLIFGIISFILLLKSVFINKKKPPLKYWKKGLVFAATGYLGFYTFIVLGVSYLGGPLATLFASFLPISVTVFGNFKERKFSLDIFILPLILIICGLAVVQLAQNNLEINQRFVSVILGLLSIVCALISWTWFSVTNGHFLVANPQIDSSTWSTLIGVCCFVLSSLVGIVLYIFRPETLYLMSGNISQTELHTYLTVITVLGIFGTWLFTFFWNMGSRRVPMSIMGQILCLANFNGLIYIFTLNKKIPSLLEFTGIFVLASGLILSFKRTRDASQKFLSRYE